jgi:phosphate transport system ATP-binding protein
MKPHISVRNLNIRYGSHQILKNVSIDIPNKKITAIIGPSGCGKTTLLKTFNRLIESADGIKIDGEVLVDGENIYGKKVEVTEMRKKMVCSHNVQCPCQCPSSTTLRMACAYTD